MVNCRVPVYFRVKIAANAPAKARAVLDYRFRPDGWRGPQRSLAFTTAGEFRERYAFENNGLVGQVARGKAEFPSDEMLPARFDSGWVEYGLNTFRKAPVTILSGADAEMLKSVWPRIGAPVVASNPYVEANLMVDSDRHYYVAIVNYSGKPLETLELRVRGSAAGNPDTAKAEFADATVNSQDDLMRITLPIDKFDFITLMR